MNPDALTKVEPHTDIKEVVKLNKIMIMRTMSYYQENFPQLTFNNDGYQYLRQEVKESHKSQIAEIESILKKVIDGFVRFDNFKPLRKGGFEVRCQQQWAGDAGFIGVAYISMTRIDACIEELINK